MQDVLGGFVQKMFLIFVCVSIFACGMVIMVTNGRLIWSMSRDRRLPGHQLWRQVPRATGGPSWATVLAAVIGALITLVLRTHTAALVTLFTASTIMPALLYASTVLLYVFTARQRRGAAGPFSLGRYEIPVIAGALIWLAYELIVLIGPDAFRDAQYYVLGALGVGLVFYLVQWVLEPAAMRTETGAHGADALATGGHGQARRRPASERPRHRPGHLGHQGAGGRPGQRSARVRRGPRPPRSAADGGVEQDPEELCESVLGAGRGPGQRPRPGPRDRPGQPGRDGAGLGPPFGRRAHPGRRLAGSQVVGRVPAAVRFGRAPRRNHRAPARPVLRRAQDDLAAREPHHRGVVTTTDTWLLHRLGAGYVTDAATASRTLLLDLDAAHWSAEACAVFGLDPAALPEVADCAGAVGETDAFGPALPVTGLAVDQQAALLAERCFAAGEAKCTYGTGAFLLATTGPVRGTVLGRAVRLGRLAAARDGHLLPRRPGVHGRRGDPLADRSGRDARADGLDADGASVTDSGGAVFVPALAGLGAPHWRPDARGAFLGLGLGVTRAHLARAVVEGIAASVALLAASVAADLGAPLTRLRADGGLTRSRLLVQAQADLLQVPVEVSGRRTPPRSAWPRWPGSAWANAPA